MKRLIVLTVVLLMMTSMVSAQDAMRMQFGVSSFVFAGPEKTRPIITTKGGFSAKIMSLGNQGAVYLVGFGKYGEEGPLQLKGADAEIVYFPIEPIGEGVRLFFLIGPSVTNIKDRSIAEGPLTPTVLAGELPQDAQTYLQAASGVGLYWDVTPRTALWFAGKIQLAEDISGVYFGLGVSIDVI